MRLQNRYRSRSRLPDPSSAGRLRNFLQMRHRSTRPSRVGEEIERCILIVANRLERNIRVGSSSGIVRDGELEHKESHDRPNDNYMFAERLPNELRPKDQSALAGEVRPTLRKMLKMFEPENTAP
jgi:hypothetical protein